MICSSCGKPLPTELVAFCASCGARAGGQQRAAQRSRRSPLVILLIAFLGVGAVVLTVGIVAVPKMQRAVRQAAEVSAVQEIHAIQAAQTQYFSQFHRYAASLAELGPNLLPAELASGVKGGYKFTLQGRGGGYRVQALPVTYGKTGERTFYMDESGVVHQRIGPSPATRADPELR